MKTTQKILALLLCGVLLFLLAGCSPASLFRKTNRLAPEYTGWTDENGNVYAVSADGKAAKMNVSDLDEAVILPGGKKAVYWGDDDDTIFVLNMKNGKIEKVAEEAYSDGDLTVGSAMLIYKEGIGDGETTIYDIERNKTIYSIQEEDAIGLCFGVGPFEDTITAVAYIKDGQLYTYAADTKKVQKLGYVDIDKDIETDCISRNGKAVVFFESKKGNEQAPVTVKVQYGTTQTEVCTLKNFSRYFFNPEVSADGKTAVVSGDEKLYLIKKGKVEQEFNIGASGYYTYTDQDHLSQDSGNIDGVYVESDDTLYYCNFKGEKTKVVGGVTNFEIKNNKIYYVKNEALYAAKIKKGTISDEVKVGANVGYGCLVSEDGKYIYYKNKEGALYAYRFGEDNAKQVAKNVVYYIINRKGTEVVFLSDEKTKEGTRWGRPVSTYTLKTYNYKKDKCTEIADGVENDLITGMCSGYYITPDNFTYAEYAGKNSNGEALWDLKHYNGKKSETVLKGATKNYY